MEEDRAADELASGTGDTAVDGDAMVSLIYLNVLEDVVRRTAEECHSSEKQLRMESAAAHAESLALATMEPVSSKGASGPPPVPTAETPAATYNGGRVYLKGNPLQTMPEIICPHCKLPRLPYPIMGRGWRSPDLTKEYCKLYPFVQDASHDVYGNPFPTDMAKSKKERDLLKQQQKTAEKDSVGGTPGSQDVDMGNTGGAAGANTGTGVGEIKLDTGGKPASYIPWHTCPSCKRSLLITRFAMHLEKCLGISGRQSSRNAMAKMNLSANGNGHTNTPLGGSRLGTPTPASQNNDSSFVRIKSKLDRSAADDAETHAAALDETPERKKKKKSSYIKKADRERMAREGGITGSGGGSSSGPLKVKLKANGLSKDRDASSLLLERKASFAESAASERSEKRERERDENDDGGGGGAPRAKKLKLSLGRSESSVGEVRDRKE